MSEINDGILDVIKSITSNCESGRLEITSCGTHGTLLFSDGKLVDARLGSLTGFQAVNAAASLRDVEFNFVHTIYPPHSGAIGPNERVVLRRFFGIETVEEDETHSSVDNEVEWNMTPEQVVPLTEVEEMDQDDLLDTPTIEAKPVALPVAEEAFAQTASSSNEFVEESSGPTVPMNDSAAVSETEPVIPSLATDNSSINREETPVTRKKRYGKITFAPAFRLPQTRVALYLVLLLALAAGVVGLISKLKARSQVATVAATVESQPAAAATSTTEVKEIPVPHSKQQVKGVASRPPSIPKQERTPVKNASSSPAVTAARRDESEQRDVNAQHLAGEWKVINTVEKTGYKPYDKIEIGFRLKIKQKGNEFTATGEKFSENGRNLPQNSRTPIHVTGSIDGDKVVATFVEDGLMRRTNGRFVWRLQSGGAGLSGTFASTAANSSGKSAATRQP